MTKEYTSDLVKNAYYGIDDNIPSDQTTIVSVRDLLKIHATLAELIRFFHQPSHMQGLQDVEKYLGSADTNGAFKLLSLAHYDIMNRMLPVETEELFDNGVFDAPENPYYFKERVKK
jgi:hypothetical protein